MKNKSRKTKLGTTALSLKLCSSCANTWQNVTVTMHKVNEHQARATFQQTIHFCSSATQISDK